MFGLLRFAPIIVQGGRVEIIQGFQSALVQLFQRFQRFFAIPRAGLQPHFDQREQEIVLLRAVKAFQLAQRRGIVVLQRVVRHGDQRRQQRIGRVLQFLHRVGVGFGDPAVHRQQGEHFRLQSAVVRIGIQRFLQILRRRGEILILPRLQIQQVIPRRRQRLNRFRFSGRGVRRGARVVRDAGRQNQNQQSVYF